MRFTNDYAADWPEISRATKEAAGWRCIRCHHRFDSTTGTPLPCDSSCDTRRGRILWGTLEAHNWREPGLNYGIHHLDGDKANNKWWNLLALCNSCHLTIQARVIPERPWLFDHSEWFLPYVCGFYGSYYGGIEITREQAIANPARWLALNPASS